MKILLTLYSKIPRRLGTYICSGALLFMCAVVPLRESFASTVTQIYPTIQSNGSIDLSAYTGTPPTITATWLIWVTGTPCPGSECYFGSPATAVEGFTSQSVATAFSNLFGGVSGGNVSPYISSPSTVYFTLESGNGDYYWFSASFDGTYYSGSKPILLTTSFVTPFTPYNGSYISSTTISFNAPYYFNCNTSYGVYDTVAIQLTDINTGLTSYSSPSTIDACGLLSDSAVFSGLSLNDSYLWRPYMYLSTSSSTPQLNGDYYYLNTASTTSNFEPFVPFTGSTFASTTLSATSTFLDFIDVPQLLSTRAPFAYIFLTYQIVVSDLSSSTLSTAIPSGTFSVPWPTSFGSNFSTTSLSVDMFSTTTISHFLSPSEISFFYNLMSAITIISTFFALYWEAKHNNLL